MFHRPSLLMTGLILMMGLVWFGMQHFYGDGRVASAESSIAENR